MLQVETVHSGAPESVTSTLVRVRGDIDIASARGFADVVGAANENADARIIVSLEDCHYFDSSGLAVLIRLHKQIGSRLNVIVKPNTTVSRIFEITALDRALNISPSMAALLSGAVTEGRRIAG